MYSGAWIKNWRLKNILTLMLQNLSYERQGNTTRLYFFVYIFPVFHTIILYENPNKLFV